MDSNTKVVNMLPFLAEAMSTNKKAYKKIDKIYNEDPEQFYFAAKESEYYTHPMSCEGDIAQEYYFKKSLGIILLANTLEGLQDKIAELLEYGWNYSTTYVKNHKNIELDDFIYKYIRKYRGIENISDDELNSSILITIVMSSFYGSNIDKDNKIYLIFIQSLLDRMHHYKSNNRINLNSENTNSKRTLRNLERALFKKNKFLYYPLGNNVSLPKVSNIYNAELHDKIIPSFDSEHPMGYNEDVLDKNNMFNLSSHNKFITAFDYIYDYEGLSLPSIIGDNLFTSKEIQELLLCYTCLFKNRNIENVELDEIEKFLYAATQIRYLCREYKKSKKFFFENYQDNLHNEISSLNKYIKSLELTNKELIQSIQKCNSTIEDLKKKNTRLANTLNKENSNKKELVALREYIFNNTNKENDSKLPISIDISLLDNIKGVIIGGISTWQSKMKRALPGWTYIDVDALNFDKALLNNKYIFINTSYISHAMYYKVVESISTNSMIFYINSTNIELCLNEIYTLVNSN